MDLTGAALSEAEVYIQTHLPLTEVDDLPGARMHLAGPRSGLSRLQRLNPHFMMPYWAHLWGGGRALVRFLAERPEAVAGRRVMDLGSGSGLVSIAAARAGAASILAVDVDPYAVVATRLNATLNGVALTILQADITGEPVPGVDIILVGDVFYELGLAEQMTAFLDRCLEARLEILVGDPGREFLPRDRLGLISDYEVADFGGRIPGVAGVFRFQR